MSDRRIRMVVTGMALVSALGGCGTTTVTESAAPVATTSEPATPVPATPVASSVPSTAAPSLELPQGSAAVELDPALFADVAIEHPFWPMAPGSTWVYRETDGEGTHQQVEVTVTDQTKQILGIDATVVHDLVTEDGKPVEDTLDYYAQDAQGNLWYLGEDTKEYENGEVTSTEGSWEGGVDGAQPGIILPAAPAVGQAYRQEYLAGHAEDAAEVVSVDQHVEVPFGTFDTVLETRDFTPLEPDVEEHKFYVRGIGPVEAVQTSGGTSHEVLLSYEPG